MSPPPPLYAAAMAPPMDMLAEHAPAVSTQHTPVTIHCNACETYLGIFENEWIRLTSSYARPAQKGIHHGTEISEKTRVVPTETGQRTAEGCTLSDVVCQKCSTTVGQYCREAPTSEKQDLVGEYFYKLSKVILKSPNMDMVDAIFTCGEDVTTEVPGSPVPSVVAPDPKWSHPPPLKSHFKDLYRSNKMMPPPFRSSQTPSTARGSRAPRLSSKPPWPASYMRDGSSSVRGTSRGSQRRTEPIQPRNLADNPEGLLALRRVLEQEVVISKITTMMENMQRELNELRASGGTSEEQTATVRTQAQDEEVQALRAENQAMKTVLRTLPAQTQFENPPYLQDCEDPFGIPESNSTELLGKRKRDSDAANDIISSEDEGITGVFDDLDAPISTVSGLAALERDAAEGYSVWQGEEEGSEGGDFSDGNENDDENDSDDNDQSRSLSGERPHSEAITGERHSARSRERRQTLPADFVAQEQRYLMSDSGDENFDPSDPKVKGRKHKRTRSAERRRRERVERTQESIWKKGVPGGGYENGDGWVEQKRHHSGRFGRKAAVGDGLAVYPKYVNDRLFANGRQIPTTHKRLARELVYLGLDDWIDKDKSDALYRRTIRVARKHYAFHHGGISSKALCQGKYTRKDLEQVGMWDEELYEEINMGEESDVDKLDFPLDPALQKSIERWKKEGAQAKERRKKAAQEAAVEAGEHIDDHDFIHPTHPNGEASNQQPQIFDINDMTQFSDDDGSVQPQTAHSVPQVPDRVERHTKFDAIWQAPRPSCDNSVLSIIQYAEARIKAAEEEMGEPTFKSKKAQKFRTIGEATGPTSENLVDDTDISTKKIMAKGNRKRTAPVYVPPSMDTFQKPMSNAITAIAVAAAEKPKGTRTVAEHLKALDFLEKKEQNAFLRELRAYFAVNQKTGAELSVQEHISLTDEQLKEYGVNFLETNVVMVGGSRKIGLEYWPEDGSKKLSYSENKEKILREVYCIFLLQRFNKARRLRSQLKQEIDEVDTALASAPHAKSTGHGSSTPASSQLMSELPFDTGLRYEFKPGFRGNNHYYADGKPRTPKDAARLKRRFEEKIRGRMSLPASSSIDKEILEEDQARRRATMLGVTPIQTADRKASVLGDSVLQMASAMNQLTRAFEPPVEQLDLDATSGDHDQDIIETMEYVGRTTTESIDEDDAAPRSYHAVVKTIMAAETKDASPELEIETQTVSALMTRTTTTRASNSAKSANTLTESMSKPKQPNTVINSQSSPSSLSGKENATPVPDPGTGPSSISGDMEPPMKKAKTILTRDKGRLPRKSAAELDQMAKEVMDRETRSNARSSRNGLHFGSSFGSL